MTSGVYARLRTGALYFSIMVGCLIVATPTSAQDDAGQMSAQLSDQAMQSLGAARGTLSSALRGDRQAMLDVATQYAGPAVFVLLLVVVAYMVASTIGRIVGSTISKHVDMTLGKFFGRATKIAIMVLVLLTILGYFNINVTSFAAILAAAGFAVGMALQGTLSNFAAGVMLLVFRPFQVADYIKVDGVEGSVEEVELFTTKLNTPDNRHIIVPNGSVFGAQIENLTRNTSRRVEVVVGVDYSADLGRTRQVLMAALTNVDGVLEQAKPEVILAGLNQLLRWTGRCGFGVSRPIFLPSESGFLSPSRSRWIAPGSAFLSRSSIYMSSRQPWPRPPQHSWRLCTMLTKPKSRGILPRLRGITLTFVARMREPLGDSA